MGKNLLRTKLSLLLALLMIFSPVMPLVDGVKTVAAEEVFEELNYDGDGATNGQKELEEGWDSGTLKSFPETGEGFQKTKLPEYTPASAEPDATVYDLEELEEAILDLLLQWEESFVIRFIDDEQNINGSDITGKINKIFTENDYINYNVSKWSYGATEGSTVADATIIFTFTFRTADDQEYPTKKQQEAYVDQTVEDFLENNIPSGLNQHFIVKRIHDYIVANVGYDTTLNRYTAFEALKQGASVCQGYALAAYKMLDEAGVEVIIVEGEAGQGDDLEGHAWNMVKLDGNWYNLDKTWNDPVPDVPGRVLYTYYNKTDSEMADTHTPNPEIDYPEADTVYYNSVMLFLGELFGDNDNLAPGVTEEDIDNADDLIEIFEGDDYSTLKLLVDEAYRRLEEKDLLDEATTAVDALFDDAGELIETEPESKIKDDIDYAKGLVESLDDEYAVEKADLLEKIDEAYLEYAARVLPGFFTDDNKEFLDDDATKEDIDEIYELLESLPESDERDALMADAENAYALMAPNVVAGLFKDDDLAEGVTKKDVDDAKLLLNFMSDGEEKDALMAEIERAYDLLPAEVIAYGDVDNDGSITVTDAILVLRHIVGLTVLTEHPGYGANVMARARVSGGEGSLTVGDAILILRRIVGLQPDFPVEIG